MTDVPALEQLKAALVTGTGQHLRNTVHLPGLTCARCRGTMLEPGQHICDRCASYPADTTADLLGSIIYGVDGLPSAEILRDYKDATPRDDVRATMLLLLAVTLSQHLTCAGGLVGADLTRWATVPSLSQIGSPHPLRTMLTTILPAAFPEIRIAASQAAVGAGYVDRRRLNPALYRVQGTVPAGQHVLVVDDTWVSGGHAQSVAMALKQAGAAHVSILTVGRWLNPKHERTQLIYRQAIAGRHFNPDTCPWTAAGCPASPTPTRSTRAPIPWDGFSWDAPGRIAPACRMIVDILGDGHWHRCATIASRVAQAYELQPATVSKLLQGMVKMGGLEQRGATARRKRGGVDMREVRLS